MSETHRPGRWPEPMHAPCAGPALLTAIIRAGTAAEEASAFLSCRLAGARIHDRPPRQPPKPCVIMECRLLPGCPRLGGSGSDRQKCDLNLDTSWPRHPHLPCEPLHSEQSPRSLQLDRTLRLAAAQRPAVWTRKAGRWPSRPPLLSSRSCSTRPRSACIRSTGAGWRAHLRFAEAVRMSRGRTITTRRRRSVRTALSANRSLP